MTSTFRHVVRGFSVNLFRKNFHGDSSTSDSLLFRNTNNKTRGSKLKWKPGARLYIHVDLVEKCGANSAE